MSGGFRQHMISAVLALTAAACFPGSLPAIAETSSGLAETSSAPTETVSGGTESVSGNAGESPGAASSEEPSEETQNSESSQQAAESSQLLEDGEGTPSEPEEEASLEEPDASEPAETAPIETEPAKDTPQVSLDVLKEQFFLLAALPEEEAATLEPALSRLILLGDPDGSLRIYLESQIEKFTLTAKLAALQETIDTIAAEGPLAEIETAVDLSGETPSGQALLAAVSDVSETAAALLDDVAFEENPALYAAALTASNMLKAGDIVQKQVAAAQLFQALLDSGTLTEAGIQTAQNGMKACFEAVRRTSPGPKDAEKLDSVSKLYGGTYQNAEFMAANSFLAVGRGEFQLTNPVFFYGGEAMLSLEDAAALLGGEILETGNEAAVALEGEGFLLEAVLGESDAYLNDRLQKLAQPALYMDGVCYLPLSAAAVCGGYKILRCGGEILVYDSVFK